MTLLYTEIEEELRAAVRDLLANRCSPSTVLARLESPASTGASPYDLDLWKALARDIGVAGLLIPEELGGAGASAREVAIVLEELGRAVAPVPFLTSAVLATRALLAARVGVASSSTSSTSSGTAVAAEPGPVVDHAVITELLEQLASGETTAALTVPFATSPYRLPIPTMTLEAGIPENGQAGGVPENGQVAGVVISGRVNGVAGAEAADVLLVPVRVATGISALAVVDASARGVEITPVTSLDLTRPIATITFDSVPARIAVQASEAEVPGVRDALTFTAGLLASEQLGLAEWCLTSTVEYVKERKQFARPVGSFQALKHRLADLWLEIVGARAAARNAADRLAASPSVGEAPAEVATAAAVAQAHCAAVAVHAAEECVQLHGGIGMTWEHPAHLYLKRAKADEIALGTPGDHRDALAELADLPAPA